MNTTAFVISLERAVERRPQVERIVASCPWHCEVAPAADGSKLSASEIDFAYQRFRYRPRYPLPLRPGEIGCFLSHRRLWQRMVDQQIDVALILEDDVELQRPLFDSALQFAVDHLGPCDYVQFQVREIGARHRALFRDGELTIVQPKVTPLRTSAQLVTRGAAERLLAVSQPFDRPVDTFLQMTWLTRVAMKVVLPRSVIEVSQQLGGSMIGGKKKPLMTRLRREILRPVYRSQIALLSHWNATITAQ